jgi:predicted Zn-dependent protease
MKRLLATLLVLLGCACEPEPLDVKLLVLRESDCDSEALEAAMNDWADAQELVYLGCEVHDHPPVVDVLDHETINREYRQDYVPVVVFDELHRANAFFYRGQEPCAHVMGIDREYLQNRRILSHEFGHMFGLEHTDDPRSVMRDAMPGPEAFTDLATPLDCDP